jgi:hypothetical protein
MSTRTPITSQVVTANVATVTFNSIPQNYTDLILISSPVSTTGTNTFLTLRYNEDSGSNYSSTIMRGNGSTTGGVSLSNTSVSYISYSNEVSTTAGRSIIITQLQNYSNSTTNKTSITRNNDSALITEEIISLWRNTSPITSITIDMDASGDTIAIGSTFNLYGIQEGGGYALGGDTVTTDGTYWYHTFLSSGAFIPSKILTVDYLVVAGGGGGGSPRSGGGGAGGLRSTVTATGGGGSLETALSLTANTPYPVTVGAGGTGGTGGTGTGTNGGNSAFSTITSTGGGFGGIGSGSNSDGFGRVGGSGGGGAGNNGDRAGGSGTANQGFAGGTGTDSAQYGAGGGGGAGAVGASGTTSTGGNGGAGVAVAISGSSVTYAGGGGAGILSGTAGSGGSGGGGGGGAPGTAGTANTGGGGGGSTGASGTGGAGGSGIVVVRYAV